MENKSNLKKELVQYAKKVASNDVLENGYFYDYRRNIFGEKMNPDFEKMFLKGGGDELASKACAAYSSSMLSYNFFHWVKEGQEIIIKFDGCEKEYDEVLFEVRMDVLRSPSRPAYMDVVLRNKSGDWLFIESKFLEYMNTDSFKMSDSYFDSKRYFAKGDKWVNFISKFKAKTKDTKLYWDGIKQEICHLIGLTNWIEGEKEIEKVIFEEGKDIRFINLVFEPDKDEFKKEYELFKSYREKGYKLLLEELKDAKLIPDKLKMEFMNYSDLWNNVKKCKMPARLEDYLWEHYMKYSSVNSK